MTKPKSFGVLPAGARLERIKQSPNYKNDAFQNLESTDMRIQGASYFTVMRKFFAKGIDREPINMIPSVKTDLRTSSPENPSVIWFGHSSYLITIGDKKILIDPVFSERTSPFRSIGKKAYPGTLPYSVDDMPEIDLLLITHDHYDHLDYDTILKLKPKVKRVCTSLGVGSHLEFWGIDSATITEFDWWQCETIFPDVDLTATPARHFSGRGLTRNKTLWSSFVLRMPSYKIFIGGDSGYDASFKKIGETFGPFDLALLECGQYDPMWPLIHMMPEQTVQAALDLKAKLLMPVHWSKYTLSLHRWYDPIQRVTKRAGELGMPVTTPMIGENVSVGKNYPASRWWEAVIR